MLYRIVPKNGDKLSILGFGAMRLPQKNMHIDKERAKAQIYHAIESGVNYIDTAYIYHMGASEKFLGEILQGEWRERVKLATKMPMWLVKKYEDFERLFAEQLDRLQTDHIDYYLLHSLGSAKSFERFVEMGVFRFLEEKKAEGKIVNIGFSYHGNAEDFKKIIDAYDWTFAQIQFNFFDENSQATKGGLEYAAARNIAMVIMEPLRGGSLAKVPPKVQAIYDAAAEKRSPAQWALRWVWNHPGVTLLLSGMNDEAHIEENLQEASSAAPNCLSDAELAMFEEVKREYRSVIKVPCTACRYCMPCPAGVDIPGCFELYNEKHLFGSAKTRFDYISRLGPKKDRPSALASQCVQCGKCERHCPQKIAIRSELQNVKKEMEGFSGKVISGAVKLLRI